ncbi:MAG: hypothetical protein EZS28_016655 [Streblomastix strix]|uniref:Transmembrane protein n=1 Tax=Streblomastix strix TaxID=222440 RepID=A0A5J4VZJ5_9EUKA|nr:MAG: hypothetical protein EZS28_016655 [Streblomastix strix]
MRQLFTIAQQLGHKINASDNEIWHIYKALTHHINDIDQQDQYLWSNERFQLIVVTKQLMLLFRYKLVVCLYLRQWHPLIVIVIFIVQLIVILLYVTLTLKLVEPFIHQIKVATEIRQLIVEWVDLSFWLVGINQLLQHIIKLLNELFVLEIVLHYPCRQRFEYLRFVFHLNQVKIIIKDSQTLRVQSAQINHSIKIDTVFNRFQQHFHLSHQ